LPTRSREFFAGRGNARRPAAIREKKFGIWQPTSWRQWLQISKDIAYALHATGFRPGDVASIVANAVPNGCMPIWASSAPAVCHPASIRPTPQPRSNISSTIVGDAGDLCRGRGAARQDPVVRARCPTFAEIVVFDMEGLSALQRLDGAVAAEFTALGRNVSQGKEAQWDAMVGSRSADDLAILVYTSGTTGPPKGAMHSNRGGDQSNASRQRSVSLHRRRRAAGVPAALSRRRAGRGYYNSLALGSVMNFAESPETVPDQSARGAADGVSRGAADLGKILFRDHDRAQGSHSVPELDVPQRACDRHRMTESKLEGQTPRAVVAGSPTRSPIGWCSAISAACSGSIVAGSLSPARRRSRRI